MTILISVVYSYNMHSSLAPPLTVLRWPIIASDDGLIGPEIIPIFVILGGF